MKIGIKCLSPVHIGSGTQYQGNSEYLYFQRENVLVVIDEAKILGIIGIENMHIWISYIEDRCDNNNFLNYLQQRKPDLKPTDVAARIIPLIGGKIPQLSNTLREHIHNGMGVPYIPGSSLKGAMRTALFAGELLKKYNPEGIPEGKLGYYDPRRDKISFNDKRLQQEVFGGDPNADWLRLLQVGDCYFQSGTTCAAFSETLNERQRLSYEIKEEVKQLIEYLPSGTSGEFVIHVPEQLKELIIRKKPGLFNPLSEQLNGSFLFKIINKHSIRLLKDEISFFEGARLPNSKMNLPAFLEDLLGQANKYADNECLIRMGFGTGYRNMTGDWVKELVIDDSLYDNISTASRRTPRYNGMPLPKSRRIMFDGVYMGYIKLTINQL